MPAKISSHERKGKEGILYTDGRTERERERERERVLVMNHVFSQPSPRGFSDQRIRKGIKDRSIADGQIAWTRLLSSFAG